MWKEPASNLIPTAKRVLRRHDVHSGHDRTEYQITDDVYLLIISEAKKYGTYYRKPRYTFEMLGKRSVKRVLTIREWIKGLKEDTARKYTMTGQQRALAGINQHVVMFPCLYPNDAIRQALKGRLKESELFIG